MSIISRSLISFDAYKSPIGLTGMCSILRMLIEESLRPEKGVALLVRFRRISGLPMPIVLEGMITEYNTARSRRVHDYLSRGALARHFNDPYPYSQDTF
ncbi:hypothetical protein KQX54_000241 [Cotesia glomerata]|uniref:Uncharacterized protein n=1 Tax=Cotesia glomerata TaxID=32391 RepID=A0AAV7IVK3_COTGL|nr:hypothetical protein KQX54_000241 [Cotesia glomerata]